MLKKIIFAILIFLSAISLKASDRYIIVLKDKIESNSISASSSVSNTNETTRQIANRLLNISNTGIVSTSVSNNENKLIHCL